MRSSLGRGVAQWEAHCFTHQQPKELIMVTRTTKQTPAPDAIKSGAKRTSVHAQREAEIHAAAQAQLESEFRTTKIELIGLLAGLATSGALGYAGTQAITYLSVGAAVMTGSAFLAFMIWFVGFAMVAIGAIMAGARVQRLIVDGTIDHKITAARGWVSDKLSITTARFSMRGAA